MKSFNFNLNKSITNYISHWNSFPNLFPNYTAISVNRYIIKNNILTSMFNTYYLTDESSNTMLLDILFLLQEFNTNFSFRRSCREGICGSCSMNINGKNTLACIFNIKHNPSSKNLSKLKYNHIIINPLPHMPIIKDLVISLNHFYNQYNSIQPYRQITKSNDLYLKTNKIQKKDRALLDGIYECILCACCSTSCPSYWWNNNVYLGPAILLQAFRWVIDPNDDMTLNRLFYLNDQDKLYKCHNIMNCSLTCPKHLKPAESIMQIKKLIANVNLTTKTQYLNNYLQSLSN